MERSRTIEEFARANERVRVARLRENVKLPPVERLERTLRLSKFIAEIAAAGREARADVRP